MKISVVWMGEGGCSVGVVKIVCLSSNIPVFDFSLYAIWTMRTAFEINDARELDVDAARARFLYDGDIIERLNLEGKSFDGKVAVGGGKYKDRE